MGINYCQQARGDLHKANETVNTIFNSIVNGDLWEDVKSTVVKANNGDQQALEDVATLIFDTVSPSKFSSFKNTTPMKVNGVVRIVITEPTTNMKPNIGGYQTVTNEVSTQVQNARIRQHQMLNDNVGYNMNPFESDANYPSIGRYGTNEKFINEWI
ncbi:hypothetical protein [Xenorhabdus cabanillasii]|uniref:hypothetical protein n=1 Tax=Xenorhabdus cabanillasii TaxID=351673 RepID=UPI001FD21BF7|nr:hypothetical protein [Xenorhabdus cabanillasii]